MGSYRDRLPAVGGGVVIKSVQRGFASINAGATSTNISIVQVNTSKSFLTFTYNVRAGDTDTPNNGLCGGSISGSGQLTFSRYSPADSQVDIAWEVVEYLSGVSVQRGSSVFTGLSLSIPISNVSLGKSFLSTSMLSSSGSNIPYRFRPRCYLSSASSISANREADYGSGVIQWEVITYV